MFKIKKPPPQESYSEEFMHVAYCLDANYRQHFGAAVTSLLSNCSDVKQLTVHVVTDETDAAFNSQLDKLRQEYPATIELHIIHSETMKSVSSLPRAKSMIQFSSAVYFRFLLPEILPKTVDKCLYLDTDTIVVNDIKPIFATDLTNQAFAAVLDYLADRWGTPLGVSNYVNTGVMLMNLDYWRENNVRIQCEKWATDNPEKLNLADQCAMNYVLQNAIKLIDGKWNYFVVNRKPAAPSHKEAVIFHFITADKPWHVWYDNQLKEHYWRYLELSPWKGAKPDFPKTIIQYKKLIKFVIYKVLRISV